MNLRTTLVLAVLAVAGFVVWQTGPKLPPALDPHPAVAPVEAQGPVAVFDREVKPDRVKRVVVQRGKETALVFNRAGKEWTMPGGWPTRSEEVQALVERLCAM